MNSTLSPIIKVADFATLYRTEKPLVVFAGNGANAVSAYTEKHIKGSIYADMDTQLAAIKEDAAKGGRHPLPTPADFGVTLGQMGITPESHVIVYDNVFGANAAARLWWMLYALGHQKVQVLNGGVTEAEKAGIPVASGTETLTPQPPYPTTDWQLPLADMAEAALYANNTDSMVIDVRDAPRYAGKTEPIDLIAGHIPGAVNIPFKENLDADMLFLPAEVLKEKYTRLLADTPADKVIVHCGSGVTACHTLLAMAQAGLPIPKLYVGSWSEWSRNNKPIGVSKE